MGTFMHRAAGRFRRLATAAAVAALAACSSGGDETVIVVEAPPVESPPDPALRFVPTSLTTSAYEGDASLLAVDAFPQYDFEGFVQVRIEDPEAVFRPNAQVEAQSDGSYRATFQLAEGLAAGTHEGAVMVRVCRDSVCSAEHPGSPVELPYHVVVVSHTNLSPLAAWEGVGDWQMFQQNAAHTGYVPMAPDASTFNARWLWRAEEGRALLGPVVASGGRVYASVGGYFAPVSVVALDEFDAATVWVNDLGTRFTLNPPAVADGALWVATSGHEDTFLWSLDAASGATLWGTPFDSQWERYYAPTIYGGGVYTNGGYYGGANAFDAASGAARWFAPLNQYDEWTPAVDEDHVYAYLGESCSGCNNAGLNVIDRATGSWLFRIQDAGFNWSGWSISGSPMIGPDGAVLSLTGLNSWEGNALIRFDIAGQSVDWTVPGRFATQPAYAAGTVYVADLHTATLQARSVATGALLWSWPRPSDDGSVFEHNVVVTDTVVFVSTARRVYAVSLATHETLWSYPYGGQLAISAHGVLYVVRDDGALAAINLR